MRLPFDGVITLADWLTLSRLLAVIPLSVFWWLPGGAWLCFLLFTLAALTDYADGIVARRLGVSSAFGVMLDPIADKMLVLTALLLLALSFKISWVGMIAFWLIVWREIMVAGLREYLAHSGVALPVVRLAKYKTAAQMTACAVLFWENAYHGDWPYLWGEGALVLAAGLTVWTGIGYFQASLKHLKLSA